MAISECPVDECEKCEHYRTESWCARAIPDRPPLSDLYKSYMEGFWEALDWCEEHYKAIEEIIEEVDQKIVDGIYVEVIHCGDCALSQEIYDFDNLLSKDWVWCPKNKRTKSVKGYCSEAISKEDCHDI